MMPSHCRDWSYRANEAELSYCIWWGEEHSEIQFWCVSSKKIRETLKVMASNSERTDELLGWNSISKTSGGICSCTSCGHDRRVKSRLSLLFRITWKTVFVCFVSGMCPAQSHSHTVTKNTNHKVNLVQLVPLMCWCALLNKLTVFGHPILIVSIFVTVTTSADSSCSWGNNLIQIAK